MQEGNISEEIQEILKELEENVPEIEASALISAEGFPIASALPRDIDEIRVAAMTAAILNMGERAAMDLHKGELNAVIIQTTKGYIVSVAAGEDAVLTATTTKEARLGFLLLYIERAAKKISEKL
ncbi:MAG TPA: roadblock/LC7 domain-containing protein [Candidatus Deferrimicrobium sp.]|nr:roadblock/LC7 domain-containing protein [Candidatus Deferrimicrobium sp.]